MSGIISFMRTHKERFKTNNKETIIIKMCPIKLLKIRVSINELFVLGNIKS